MSMINEILGASPRYKRRKRVGRGEGSGYGKTSGRGTKGAGARGGGPHWKPGHEGGQTPLHRRLPARGFSNDDFERQWYIVNLEQLEKHFQDGATVDPNALVQAKLVPDLKLAVKILGNGALTRKLTIHAGWYSKSAFEKIGAAGGTALNPKGEPFKFPKPKVKFAPQPKDGGKQGKGKKAKGEQTAPKAETPAAQVPAAPAQPAAPAEPQA